MLPIQPEDFGYPGNTEWLRSVHLGGDGVDEANRVYDVVTVRLLVL